VPWLLATSMTNGGRVSWSQTWPRPCLVAGQSPAATRAGKRADAGLG
jgi:hypothetical protein